MNETLEIYAQAIRRIEHDVNAFREELDKSSDANPHFCIDQIEATLYELTEILSARTYYA